MRYGSHTSPSRGKHKTHSAQPSYFVQPCA